MAAVRATVQIDSISREGRWCMTSTSYSYLGDRLSHEARIYRSHNNFTISVVRVAFARDELVASDQRGLNSYDC